MHDTYLPTYLYIEKNTCLHVFGHITCVHFQNKIPLFPEKIMQFFNLLFQMFVIAILLDF